MRPSLAPAAAAAFLVLGACHADAPTAVPSPLAPAAATALASFSSDARIRLLPTLPADLQPTVAQALATIEEARTVDDATRSLSVAAELMRGLADHPSAAALALDLSAMRQQLDASSHP